MNKESRKVEIAKALVEADETLSESSLMKNHTKAELFEMWQNLQEPETAEPEETPPAEKPVTRRSGMHLASQMKSVRGTARAKIELVENIDEGDPAIEFTYYSGSIDSPKSVLPVRLQLEPVEELSSDGSIIVTLKPIFYVHGESYGQYAFYKVVRTHFNL